jgi:hypothetical protein
MKKVKIMLLSSLVVATVAGAVAFKAHSRGGAPLCGTTTNSCPNLTDDLYDFTNVNPLPGVYCTNVFGQTTTCLPVKPED